MTLSEIEYSELQRLTKSKQLGALNTSLADLRRAEAEYLRGDDARAAEHQAALERWRQDALDAALALAPEPVRPVAPEAGLEPLEVSQAFRAKRADLQGRRAAWLVAHRDDVRAALSDLITPMMVTAAGPAKALAELAPQVDGLAALAFAVDSTVDDAHSLAALNGGPGFNRPERLTVRDGEHQPIDATRLAALALQGATSALSGPVTTPQSLVNTNTPDDRFALSERPLAGLSLIDGQPGAQWRPGDRAAVSVEDVTA